MRPTPFAGRFSVPAALIALLAVTAACSSAATTTPSPSEAASVAPSVSASTAPTPTAEPTDTPAPTPGVGVQVLVGEEQYITVTLVERWEGTDQIQPAAGNTFVTVNVRVDAITATSIAPEDFALEDGDGNVYTNTPLRSPRLYDLNGIEPTHNYAGFLTFEIPAQMTTDFTLIYSPSFLTTTYEIPLS